MITEKEILNLLASPIDKELNVIQCLALVMIGIGIANKIFEEMFIKMKDS